MSLLALCANPEGCDRRFQCRRYTDKASDVGQSWAAFQVEGGCEDFVDNGRVANPVGSS